MKEQETHLTLQEHDYDDEVSGLSLITFLAKVYALCFFGSKKII